MAYDYVKYHPVFLDLRGRPILIVGGGNIAVEKLNSLLPSGAEITVLAPLINDQVRAWVESGENVCIYLGRVHIVLLAIGR